MTVGAGEFVGSRVGVAVIVGLSVASLGEGLGTGVGKMKVGGSVSTGDCEGARVGGAVVGADETNTIFKCRQQQRGNLCEKIKGSR